MLSDVQPTNGHKDTFSHLMDLGTAAHVAGDSIKALTAFESALALDPQDSHAVSACAALLFELSRPRAAFALLQSIENQLLLDADGCANLGLAALSCHQPQAAASYFDQALKLRPTHAPALTHLGMLAAREQRWPEAIDYARQCTACAPNDETAYTNLIDFLLGARHAPDALALLHAVPKKLKNHPQIAIRQVMAQALNAEFDAANKAMTQLSPLALNELTNFLQRGGAVDLFGLFYQQALSAMQACDWRDYPRLCALIGEENLHPTHQASPVVSLTDKTKTLPPFSNDHGAKSPADCIRIGIAASSLRDVAATEALAAELTLYDSTRFKFFIYSPTPQPQAVLSAPLAAHQVIEIAHFTDEEAVWRIRLDRLDIWFDAACGTPWYRPYLAQRRVALVQVLPIPARQQLPEAMYDYALSDTHLAGLSNANPNNMALASLPHTCWFAPCAAAPAVAMVTRTAAGLPVDAFVVCVFGTCAHITPKTFALWMQLLTLVPRAVLWLSPCARNAQANLLLEAMQAGVQAERLIFAPVDANRHAMLALADLYLDAPGNSSSQSLVEALHAGVPTVMSEGTTSSVLNAAGLGDCVFDSAEACLAKTLYLAQNPDALNALRERMRTSAAQSPLFDVASRASERAAAWTLIVERARAGLMLETFDVPLAGTSR